MKKITSFLVLMLLIGFVSATKPATIPEDFYWNTDYVQNPVPGRGSINGTGHISLRLHIDENLTNNGNGIQRYNATLEGSIYLDNPADGFNLAYPMGTLQIRMGVYNETGTLIGMGCTNFGNAGYGGTSETCNLIGGVCDFVNTSMGNIGSGNIASCWINENIVNNQSRPFFYIWDSTLGGSTINWSFINQTQGTPTFNAYNLQGTLADFQTQVVLGDTYNGTAYTTTTTTTTLIPPPQCQTDIDCQKGYYCKTGVVVTPICSPKKNNTITTSSVYCYRNHECISGICAAHELNNADGDYPPYNPTLIIYSNDGDCIANTFKMEVSTLPSNPVIGGTFDVFIKLRDNNNILYDDANCSLFGKGITSGNSLSWIYDAWGNQITTNHKIDSNIGQDYNYITELSLNINSTITAGSYLYDVYCFGNDGESATRTNTLTFTSTLNNRTEIKIVGNWPAKILKNQAYTLNIRYVNTTSKAEITGATCTAESYGVNQSIPETSIHGLYQTSILFSASGNDIINIVCVKSTHETARYSKWVLVESPHCNNLIKDYDETGLDCGGADCNPCSINPDLCLDDGESCDSNSDCCNEYCLNSVCKTATCNDGIKNQGEIGIDCGGPCASCQGCIKNNDCSIDGSSYCDRGTGGCMGNNCTSDADCPPLSWYIPETNTYMNRDMYCDLDDELCRFANPSNTTLTPFISPLSGLTSNSSGTILYLSNCDDRNNGFKVSTGANAKISYSFASQTLSPAIPSYPYNQQFSDPTYKTTHSGLIPELCGPNKDGFGGLPGNSERVYAVINLLLCTDKGICTNRLIDTLTFKHSLKNSLSIALQSNPGSDRIYLFNATNRTIGVFVRNDETSQMNNISTGYLSSVLYNDTQYRDKTRIVPTFYYYVNTTEGETVMARFGTVFWMPLEWDEKTQWFKLNFEIHAWMIYIILAAILVGLVYMNYRASRGKWGAG